MTAHVMVDMETTGTAPDAAILSVALVQFIPETGEIVSSFAVDIDLKFNSTDAVPFPLAMYSIQEWLDATGPAYVWSNGAGFDCVILRRALERLGYKAWPFCMDCDVRTMVMLGQQTGFDPKKDMPFEGTEHNALDDALHQVKYVSAIWQRLVGGA
ncbi:3'-5' exoribonuclease [Escherichia coli]|nr:3'-5' exoribonuclease [Escherichia coli]